MAPVLLPPPEPPEDGESVVVSVGAAVLLLVVVALDVDEVVEVLVVSADSGFSSIVTIVWAV
jgi:hypothetical protein